MTKTNTFTDIECHAEARETLAAARLISCCRPETWVYCHSHGCCAVVQCIALRWWRALLKIRHATLARSVDSPQQHAALHQAPNTHTHTTNTCQPAAAPPALSRARTHHPACSSALLLQGLPCHHHHSAHTDPARSPSLTQPRTLGPSSRRTLFYAIQLHRVSFCARSGQGNTWTTVRLRSFICAVDNIHHSREITRLESSAVALHFPSRTATTYSLFCACPTPQTRPTL